MSHEKRTLEFYVLAVFFAVFVLFLYGPLSAVLILSFQGPDGGLTFPLNGVSVHWFYNLFEQQASNRRRTWAVMAVFVAFLLFLGYGFDRFYVGDGEFVFPIGTLTALGVGILIAWVTRTNSRHRQTHSRPNQNVRICQRKCDSSQVPRTAWRFT